MSEPDKSGPPSRHPCVIADRLNPMKRFTFILCKRCGYRRNRAAIMYRYARCDDWKDAQYG